METAMWGSLRQGGHWDDGLEEMQSGIGVAQLIGGVAVVVPEVLFRHALDPQHRGGGSRGGGRVGHFVVPTGLHGSSVPVPDHSGCRVALHGALQLRGVGHHLGDLGPLDGNLRPELHLHPDQPLVRLTLSVLGDAVVSSSIHPMHCSNPQSGFGQQMTSGRHHGVMFAGPGDRGLGEAVGVAGQLQILALRHHGALRGVLRDHRRRLDLQAQLLGHLLRGRDEHLALVGTHVADLDLLDAEGVGGTSGLRSFGDRDIVALVGQTEDVPHGEHHRVGVRLARSLGPTDRQLAHLFHGAGELHGVVHTGHHILADVCDHWSSKDRLQGDSKP